MLESHQIDEVSNIREKLLGLLDDQDNCIKQEAYFGSLEHVRESW